MDLYADRSKKDSPNAFVELLWERGQKYERELADNLDIPYTNLMTLVGSEKAEKTREAIERSDDLIYKPRLEAEGLVGDPDLIRREGSGYVPIDIKAGRADDGDGGTYKDHYAVQLGVYVDLLERLGCSAGRYGYIWDVHGNEVQYDFIKARRSKSDDTYWDFYVGHLDQAKAVVAGVWKTKPAACSDCKMCHWYSECKATLIRSDDLSLIPELGRAKRDALNGVVSTVKEFANADTGDWAKDGAHKIKGVGPKSIEKFQRRARLLSENGKPYLLNVVSLPHMETELFFDVETDPMRDICYLHGFVERNREDNRTESYVSFFMEDDSQDQEEETFRAMWRYVSERQPCGLYFYSKYERTTLRKLQKKYPSVCSADDITDLFELDRSVDLLYDVVKSSTEWPTYDHSIKTLATYLGFEWRDTHPSGAASIEWFDKWIETGDQAIRQRILDYNEDDCRATRVLLDGIRSLRSPSHR
jgi:uncharacterized protein